jgi:hypothetical protein
VKATAATADAIRSWLESVEAELAPGLSAEAVTSLAYVAGRDITIDPDGLAAARRRALFVLAAGGDPHRTLGLDEPGVDALARDLDAPELRTQLARGLEALRRDAAGLPLVEAVVAELVADPDLAWRAYACALLAEELGGD